MARSFVMKRLAEIAHVHCLPARSADIEAFLFTMRQTVRLRALTEPGFVLSAMVRTRQATAGHLTPNIGTRSIERPATPVRIQAEQTARRHYTGQSRS
jgi:hypothetical protein